MRHKPTVRKFGFPNSRRKRDWMTRKHRPFAPMPKPAIPHVPSVASAQTTEVDEYDLIDWDFYVEPPPLRDLKTITVRNTFVGRIPPSPYVPDEEL